MNKQIGNVTAAEMLAELNSLTASKKAAPPTDDDAKTIKEWALFWGINRYLASDKVAEGRAAGLIERVKRKRQRVDGVVATTTCFKWVGKAKK